MERPLLSLCLIVRDEEAMLPGFLAAVDGLWDELVAADTGSADRTTDLLTAAGAVVVSHPWQDDFAAARNASLEAARGRWILVLDADERVSPALADEIRALVGDERAGAATLVMRNALPGGLHKDADLLRLFRNDPRIRYRHAIHEDASAGVAAFLDATGLQMRRLSGIVQHLGYVRDHAAARRKQDRDTAILRRLVADDPRDLYSWYKLLEQARFWNDVALRAETGPGAAAAFDAADGAWLKSRPWSGDLAALIAAAVAGDADRRLAWLEERCGRTAATAAWHLARGGWLEELGRIEPAREAFGAALAAAGEAPHLATRAEVALARLAAAGGDLDGAARLAVAAAARSPADAEALLAAAAFCRARGDDDLAAFVAAQRRIAPGADGDLARALLAAGAVSQAAAVLEDVAAVDPAAVMGLLVCALVLGEPFDRTVDLEQAAADDALREWVGVVWRSRRTDLMTAVAGAAGSIAGVFPWLPGHLAEETRRLAAGR